MRRSSADQPTVITTVPVNDSDGYDQRRKRYAIMMATRAVCVILAASLYHVSVAASIGLGVAGFVLPWCAVIIANDRPAKKKAVDLGAFARSQERGLPSGNDERVVDG
jgi:Flp pilus assembly protein TadB